MRDFPGGPLVKTSPFNARSASLIPGQGVEIPQAQQPKPKHKTETRYQKKKKKKLIKKTNHMTLKFRAEVSK